MAWRKIIRTPYKLSRKPSRICRSTGCAEVICENPFSALMVPSELNVADETDAFGLLKSACWSG